jgi:Ca2+-binding RTX toxin-like protein
MTIKVAAGGFAATDQFTPAFGSADGPRVVSLADGSFLLAWALGSDLKALLFDRHGSKVGDWITISTSGDPDQVALLALPTGGFVASWAAILSSGPDDSGFSVWARVYGAGGQPAGSAFPVNTTTFASQTQPTIAPLSGGGFMIAWTDQYGDSSDSTHGEGVRGQLFDSAGARVGVEFAVNTDPFLSQYNPRAFALAGGDNLLTWATSHDGIHAQFFDSAGAKKGGEFRLGSGLQTAVGLPSGGFFTVDGSSGELIGQFRASDGSNVGQSFQINTTTAGDQFMAQAAVLPSGSIMVSWYDSGGGSAHTGVGDIKAQLLDPSGTKVGSEFTVNTATAGGQWLPQIAAFGSGDLAVFWVDWNSPYPPPQLQGRLLFSTQSGNAGDDVLAGTSDRDFYSGLGGNDLLSGAGADDELDGGEGDDSLSGGSGNDRLAGSDGDDELRGGAGADTLEGGQGADTFVYSQFSDSTSAARDRIVDFASGTDKIDLRALGPVTLAWQAATDPTSGASYQKVTATSSSGSLELRVDSALALQSSDFLLSGGATEGNDNLVGTDGDDVIDGLGGNDRIDGLLGADQLSGGAGDDVIAFSAVRVSSPAPAAVGSIEGGSGFDTVDLSQVTPTQVGVSGGVLSIWVGSQRFSVAGIEKIQLGGGSDLVILPDDRAEALEIRGGAGNDSFHGSGAYFLYGEQGDDDLFISGTFGPARAGKVDGGEGRDLLKTNIGFTVDLQAGTASAYSASYVIVGIEDVAVGLSGYVSTVSGDGGDNRFSVTAFGDDGAAGAVFDGRGGDDIITGSAGADRLDGGAGNDTLTGRAGNDSIDGGDGQDALYGDDGNDVLRGGAGNDLLRGGAGVDSFDGGPDDLVNGPVGMWGDVASFYEARATQAVIADLRTGAISNDGFGNAETMTGIESLEGDTAFADTLHGNDQRNLLVAGRGDTVYAYGGDDRVELRLAAALADGGSGTDTLKLRSDGGLLPDGNGDGSAEASDPFAGGWVVNLAGGSLRDGLGNVGAIAGFENVGGGDRDDIITGNAGANVLSGGGGDDSLNGAGRADRMEGGLGNDSYAVDNSGDVIVELAGEGFDSVATQVSYILSANVENLQAANIGGTAALSLTGNEVRNFIWGTQGNNVLDGAGGADFMVGYAGDDLYAVDNLGDVTNEEAGGGFDTVVTFISYTLSANVENLQSANIGGTAALSLTGNDLRNFIWGTQGNNVLDGAGGADFMVGYAGDDLYSVDNVGDVTNEEAGGGFDTVVTTFSYTLSANVENLQSANIGGTAALSLTGNELRNFIWGTQGNNVLDGAGGADFLVGYGGNDTYFVDNEGDVAYEEAGGGFDTVATTSSFALGANVENLQAANIGGSAALSLTGNDQGNFIWGTQGDNVIAGRGGNDRLFGYAGADRFLFDTAAGNSNFDWLDDFQAGTDKIVLDNSVFTALADGAFPASAFVAGTAAADADDRIIFDSASGNVFYDADGNGAGAALLLAIIPVGQALTANDFLVI